MNLEQKLMAGAEPWLSEEALPATRAAALERLVLRRRRRWLRWAGAGASAAMIVYAGFLWPVVVSVASGTPLIGPYIERMARYDEGAYWADQKGYVVPVNKSAEDKGYTLRVESILADSARTVIYYVIEGPDLASASLSRPPQVEFNKRHPKGGGSGGGELVEGRFVGSLQVDPLPTPVSVVDIRADEIAGVKGNWSISFMASRIELDKVSRIIPINQKLQGEGYDLTVVRALLAPTQTVIEVQGTVAPGVEVLPSGELVVGDRMVGAHGATYLRGTTEVNSRFAFDRVDPEEAAELLFRLTGVIRWKPGRPSLDVPGARASFEAMSFEVLGVEQRDNATAVSVRIPWDHQTWLQYQQLGDWVLVDDAGKEYPALVEGYPANDESVRLELITKERVSVPRKAKASHYAEPLAGDFTVRIPVK